MAERMGVTPANVQRDYVTGWLLASIYGGSPIGNRLVLKGGNCLRKAYFEHGRYSGDLDFSCSTLIGNQTLGRELNAICSTLAEKAGITFDLGRTRVDDKRDLDGGKHLSEARVFFRDFYGAESQLLLKLKLDVTQFDRLYLPIDTRPLIHPYSDAGVCTATLRCVRLEEVLATKLRCLLQRRHIADLFDLVHGADGTTGCQVDLRKLLTTFFRITVFGRSPSVVKGLLIDLPRALLSGFWTDYLCCPRMSWRSFDGAWDLFQTFIDRLLPGLPQRTKSSMFFPSVLRNPIMEAADTMTMLRIKYDGVERLVEPYELAFKVRGDGVGREYFYVHDTTGGRSKKRRLKTFVSENTQWIQNTDKVFEPRYAVELRKSGGAERIGSFSRR